MPAKKDTAPVYVITGVIVGPWREGDEVTAEQVEAAGLSLEHLIRLGQIDLKAPTPSPTEEA